MDLASLRRLFKSSASSRGDNRYEELVEQAIVGFLLRRPDGEILMVNEAYCRLMGYTRDELMKMKIQQVVSSIDAGVLERTNSLKVGESVRTRAHLRRKDGSDVYIEAITHRLKDGNLQSTVQDITGGEHAERARAESEQRYQELVEQAADSIWLRLPTGQMLYVNDAACNMLGYTRAELLDTASPHLIHPSDPGTAALIDAIQPLETLRIERIMRHRDGHAIPVEASARRLADGSIQVISHDISERRRSEQARAESERRYAELVDQALEGIMVRKPGGDVEFVNDTFCRMLGYTGEEMLRLNIRDIVHPEDAETLAQIQRLREGEALRLQKRMRRKDGHVIYVEVSAKRLRSGNIQTTVQDVSESRRAEERFRTIVEGSPNAMLMVDEAGHIVLVNAQTEQMFGYRREELLGKSVEMLIPVEVRGRHPALRAGFYRDPQVRATGRGRDLFGLRKDGRLLPVEIGLNPVTTREGRCVLASIIDISERKAAEARDREHQEEMREMSQRLLEAQETERRAIARELHDEVGQALTATRMNLQQLVKEAGQGGLAKRAEEASAVVSQLLQQVRQLSLDLHPSVLDDLGLAAALRWVVRTRAGGSEIKVTFELAEGLPRFTGVTEHTAFRVFQEALSNVLRHSGAQNVVVTLKHEDDSLELRVADDGRGFDPDAARRHALEGKSLGVLGMRERVRLAGGRIAIESSVGKGTHVHVWLPATRREP